MKEISRYQLQYKEEIIPYEVIRRKIKNIYIYIKEGKVTVKVPTQLKNTEMQMFVNKKAKWIYEKVKQEKNRSQIEEVIEPKDRERLEKIVTDKIEKYTNLLKETPNKVRIRDIKYAWGSCSSNRNITISKKLAKKDEKIIEYVVLHEMCHLKYMNHSEEFWKLVEKYMPEHKACRKILKHT